ncbi:hypothetical protein RHMOL_Rhmol07G0323800 [Rhododendron molle]|uniref:Uncharacterized protein n=1 Tax=Rhododendron molle TaxID=49168 RepID=A0ACC0N7M5_RHOML|nr:hypothetical protein RHMOL_Rhmol07G0323800 [Rhododendron molle]
MRSEEKIMEGDKKPSALSDVGAWAMNVISSVGIIMANKQLMSPNGYAFSFATTLTGFHFAVTALVGMVSNATGYSSSKHVPLWELLWFSIVANTSITGMNLSLMLNSVGFYQISKLSMIPVVCLMEWILHNKRYSREVKLSVVVVVIGVGVCTVTDVKVNAKGFLCACIAVLSTSLQQISIGSLQKKYSIGSFELLSKTAPIQALSLLLLGPFIDYYLTGKSIAKYKMSSGATLTFKNIMGMIIAVIGMIIYSWAMEIEKQSNTKITPHSKNSLTEEELRLLQEGVEKTAAKDIELALRDLAAGVWGCGCGDLVVRRSVSCLTALRDLAAGVWVVAMEIWWFGHSLRWCSGGVLEVLLVVYKIQSGGVLGEAPFIQSNG